MTAKAGLRTALEVDIHREGLRAQSCTIAARDNGRQDRAREPFARNRLQLQAEAARRDHIVGTRGVSHFF